MPHTFLLLYLILRQVGTLLLQILLKGALGILHRERPFIKRGAKEAGHHALGRGKASVEIDGRDQRFDRVFLRGARWQPRTIERVGTTAIDSDGTFVSDHFGLEVDLADP